MTSQYWGYGTARSVRLLATLRTVAAVALVIAARSQSPQAATDTTPPAVSITSPDSGDQVSRSVTISAAATDAVGVKFVTFKVDGTVIGTDTRPPYSVRWNSRGAADGSHTLRAEARDAAGNVGTSSPVTVIVGSTTTDADTTAPTVSVTAPTGGAQVTGTVAFTATASDAVGVTLVTFLVDGMTLSTDTSAPYSASWNGASMAAGSHTLRAQARDAAGNVGTSATVTVVVASAATDTTAPTVNITAPAGGAQVTGTVAISATASDAVGVTLVTFLVDGMTLSTDTSAPYSASWNSAAVAAGSHTLRAEARDAAGNVGTSAAVTVVVASAATDTTAPTVNITAPAGGTQVTGTVAITATASDAVGVTSVTFLVDGMTLSADTSAPYSASWNSGSVAAGSHTLRAEARDAAGNVGTSAAVTVTTAAANRPPSVTMTAPGAGSYQAPAILTLAATATDTDGSVARVDFYAGATMIGSDTASPFSITWTVSTAGSYSLSATAVDNAGATTASGAVSVAVTTPARPSTAVFEPATDNASVIRYVLDVFRDGSNPATSAPVATQDLGKPPVVSGEMTANIAGTTAALPAATYVATVTAVTATQNARSAASPPFVIATSSGSTLITRAIDVAGEAPVAAAESHGRLWVTSSTTGLVTAFDATTGDVLATIPVGLTPTGIAVSNRVGKVYVADEGSDTVSVIAKATMTLSHTISLPAPSGRRPHHVSASPDGRFIYVGELGANVVDVIDTATDEIAARFATGMPGTQTRGVAADPAGAVLYAVNRAAPPSAGALVALDADTGRWLWQLPIDGEPSGVLVAADGRTGVVTRHGSSALAVIDLVRHAVIKEIDPGPGDPAGTLQLTLDGRLALIGPSPLHARMDIVDLAALAALRPMSLAGSPAGSALPAEQLTYVCVAGSNDTAPGVVAVDTGSRTVVRRFRFPGGGSPSAVVFDPD